MLHKNKGGGVRTLFLASLALLLSTWGCGDTFRTDAIEKNPSEISKIDGNPIVTITASDFYNTNSAYLDKVVGRLAENGPRVIKAFNREIKSINRPTEQAFVTFDEVISTNSIQAKRTDAGDLLDKLSSHIRVTYPDGSAEEFVLTLQKANGSGPYAKVSKYALNKKTTWLALAPSRFYVKEDERGNEIYPVTFPAISLNNPDVE